MTIPHTDELDRQLQQILQEFSLKTRGIRGSVITDSSGLIIVSDAGPDADPSMMAALASLDNQSALFVFENVGLTGPDFVLLEGREGSIAVVPMRGGAGNLLALLSKSANVGFIKLEMKRAALRASEALGLGASARRMVEELFLMHESGILIRHYSFSPRTTHDLDAVAGMLVGVQAFIREALGSKIENLDDMHFGNYTVYFIRGRHTIAAAVTKGRGSEDVRYLVSDALHDFEGRFADVLQRWDGDVTLFPGIDDCFTYVLRGFPAP